MKTGALFGIFRKIVFLFWRRGRLWTLLPSPVTSTTGCCFCFGSVSSFVLKLFLHWSPVAYWAPTNLGSSSFSDLPQKIPCMHRYTQSPQPCSRPPLTHTSAGDSRTPTGKSGTVSCGATAPFSWVLVHKVLLCPPRVYFPVQCKFWQLYGRVNGDLLQESLCHTQICCTQSPAADHRWPIPPQEMLQHSSVSVSVGSLGPGAHKVCLNPLSISGRNGVWF